MSAVQLAIATPPHDAPFLGNAPIALKGSLAAPLPPEVQGVPLYYRWYSSLFPAAKDRYSIHPAALTSLATPFNANLAIGTHILTLAVSDRPGETEADQNATQHGGVTGGKAGKTPCIIHVLNANLKTPAANASLSKANAILEAEAPLQWGKKNPVSGLFEPNPDYHAINQIRYLWRFTPSGNPTNRSPATLTPTLAQLSFDPSGPFPIVRYQGSLPAALVASTAYTLTLRVEFVKNPAIAHETSRPITLTA